MQIPIRGEFKFNNERYVFDTVAVLCTPSAVDTITNVEKIVNKFIEACQNSCGDNVRLSYDKNYITQTILDREFMNACRNKNSKVATTLKNLGANYDDFKKSLTDNDYDMLYWMRVKHFISNSELESIFSIACLNSAIKIVKWLAESNIKKKYIPQTIFDKEFMNACRNKNCDIVFTLSRCGTDTHTDMLESFTDDDCETIKWMRSKGIILAPLLETIFRNACTKKYINIVKWIVNTNRIKQSGLIVQEFLKACEANNLEIAKLLCENDCVGSDVIINEFVKACGKGFVELAQLLYSTKSCDDWYNVAIKKREQLEKLTSK